MLGFNSLEDKVISFQIGTFGVIISRRYLLYIVLCILSALVLYTLLSFGINISEERSITNISWEEFRKDCGFDAFNKNHRMAVRTFDRTYSGRGVSWDGYVVQVNALSENSLHHYHHASSMLLKMVPDDKEKDDASIALSLSEAMTEKYKEELMQLEVGDHVLFNATIVGLGDRSHLHHLHIFGLEKDKSEHSDTHVNLHVHQVGRYKFHQQNEEPIRQELREEDMLLQNNVLNQ